MTSSSRIDQAREIALVGNYVIKKADVSQSQGRSLLLLHDEASQIGQVTTDGFQEKHNLRPPRSAGVRGERKFATTVNAHWTGNGRRIRNDIVTTDDDYDGLGWQGNEARTPFTPDSSTAARSVVRQKPLRRFSESHVILSPRDTPGSALSSNAETPVTFEEYRHSTNASSRNRSVSGSPCSPTRTLEDLAISQQVDNEVTKCLGLDSKGCTTRKGTPDNVECVIDVVEIDEPNGRSIPSALNSMSAMEVASGDESALSFHSNATIKNKAGRRRNSGSTRSARRAISTDENGKKSKPAPKNEGNSTDDLLGGSTDAQIDGDAKENVRSENSDDVHVSQLAQLSDIEVWHDNASQSDVQRQEPSRMRRVKKYRSKNRRTEKECIKTMDGSLQSNVVPLSERLCQLCQQSTGLENNSGSDVDLHSASHREAKSSSLEALSTTMPDTDNGLQSTSKTIDAESSRPSTANQSRPRTLIPKPEKRSSPMSAGNRQENRHQRSAPVFGKEHCTARSTASRLSQPHSDSLQNAFRSDPGSKSLAEDTASVSQLTNISGVDTTLKSTELNDSTDIAFKRSNQYSAKNIQKEETGSKQHQYKRDGKRESTAKSQPRDAQRADGTSASLPPLKPRESRIPAIASYTHDSHALVQAHDNVSKSNAQTTTQLQRKTSTVRGRARSFWIWAVSLLLLIFAGQYFIWNMEISGADDSLPTQTIRVLENVCPGRKPSFICGVEEELLATMTEENSDVLCPSLIETELGLARCPSFISKPTTPMPALDLSLLENWPLMLCAGIAVSFIALLNALRTTFRWNANVSTQQVNLANRAYPFRSVIPASQHRPHIKSYVRASQRGSNTPARTNLNSLRRRRISKAAMATSGSRLPRYTTGMYDQLIYADDDMQVYHLEERTVRSSSPDSTPSTPSITSTPTTRQTRAATRRSARLRQ